MYPMLDHLRLLNEAFTGGALVFALSAVFTCFRFMKPNSPPFVVRHHA